MRETIFIRGAPGAGFPTIARMAIIDGSTLAAAADRVRLRWLR